MAYKVYSYEVTAEAKDGRRYKGEQTCLFDIKTDRDIVEGHFRRSMQYAIPQGEIISLTIESKT